MSAILLLDTSVYLNVLDIPTLNQDRDSILEEFAACIEQNDHFLLPLATVWETGNHIADLGDGQTRRSYARRLVEDVAKAFNGEVPYRATHFPEREEFLDWLGAFPDMAMRSKSAKKFREGVSLADLSIIKEWERNCRLHPMSRVRVWSLDSDLSCYDRQA
ncbi:hypothetical protein [Thiococcus pfennigii]|uniref:hypothetical protein n=1 Tax=Thiococcus pfennigii TaxID=1057 RepID=UPI001905F95D|nr:hypothetical protein [Thiococcus pfennigii]MBK1700276.1 hypothetical protein [Thiococcus pfennigii]MBK1731451.1 hypothetical protein [Thiococcus pfennigii]